MIDKKILNYLHSFKDYEFHELNDFIKQELSDTHISIIRKELTRLSDGKKIEVLANNHTRWELHTPNIHPDHNVIADLDNWIVKAKIDPSYRETLDALESESAKNQNAHKLQELQIEVLRLEKEEFELKKQNQELTDKYQESQHQLTQLQIKELKRKTLYAILGALGGVALTILTEYLLGVLKLRG